MSGSWYVVVEENVGHGDRVQWVVTVHEPADDQADARALARRLASEHVPQRPDFVVGRSIFRSPSDDSLLVSIPDGRGRRHFRVTVSECIADEPAPRMP